MGCGCGKVRTHEDTRTSAQLEAEEKARAEEAARVEAESIQSAIRNSGG